RLRRHFTDRPAADPRRRRTAEQTGSQGFSSRLAVPGGAVRAGRHFGDDFLTCPTRIIRVILLAFASLVRAHGRVGPGAIRVHLAAPAQDEALCGSARRHDTLTQRTAEHGTEPVGGPSGWLMSRKGWVPRGADERSAAPEGPGRRHSQAANESSA